MSDAKTSAYWQQQAAQLQLEGQPFINGQSVASLSGAELQTTNPADGSPGFSFADCGAEDVDAAVSVARQAYQKGWQDMGPTQRKALLHAFADAIQANGETLALCDSLDMGKPISAALGEVGAAAGFIRYYAEALDKIYNGHTVPTGNGAMELQMLRPRGVVGAITPWNFPMINVALKAGPALAAGNTLVIKPSELSQRSALQMAHLAVEAGIPPGVFNVVTGAGQTGAELVRHGGVDMLTFTGSTRTGKALLTAIGGSTIKPVLLECGGKSPEIIFADMANSDLDQIATQVARGAFWNQGQVCVARTRLLVHESLYSSLEEKIVAQAAQMQVGNPLDPATMFGPLASAHQQQVVEDYIQSGVEQNATLLLDGRNPIGGETGCYVGPTVFNNVDPDSRIAREEIFGPVLSLFSFPSDEQALALANDTDYGLAATVWTRDIVRANQFAMRLKAGKVRIVASPAQAEGAGFSHSAEPCGQSGYGVEGGISGLQSYMRQQSIELALGG